MNKIERKCITCGKIFYAVPSNIKRGNAKYCSKECYNKSKLTGQRQKCLYCGKEYYIMKSKINKSDEGKYCSWDCFIKAKKENTKLKQVKCAYCGETIYRWRKDIKRTKKSFCSHKCKANWQRGKIPYNKGFGGVLIECINCGKIIKVKPIRVKRGIRFCSNKCRYEYMIGENSSVFGEKNPSWKGGITNRYLQIRKSFKYRQWRSDVFTRDNYICQACGEIKGGSFNAHHIKSFLSIMRKYEITTFKEAMKCEELWNINNGITLCEDCHKETHEQLRKKDKDSAGVK